MRLQTIGAAGFAALALSLASCSDAGVVAPSLSPGEALRSAAAAPTTWISELHYDNGGADSGEFVEVTGATGTSLDGWQIVLYNGNGGTAYNTVSLSGVVPELCSGRGVLSFAIPGIQNGSPDGMALVDASGAVVELLSYEGSFTAVGGPADGMLLADIGVSQSGAQTGTSLQRGADGAWQAEAAATPGACNGGAPAPPAEVASVTVAPSSGGTVVGGFTTFGASGFAEDGTPAASTFAWTSADPAIASIDPSSGVATGVSVGQVTITATAANGIAGTAVLTVSAAPAATGVRISEIHYDNFGTDEGEAIELTGPAGTDLTGWRIVLYNGSNSGPYHTTDLSALSSTCGADGYLVVSYPANGIQNGSPDAIALVDASGEVVEFLSYEGVLTAVGGAANGRTSTDIGVSEPSNTPAGQSLHRGAGGTWHGPAASTFGPCNTPGTAGGGGASLTIVGRDGGDPPLPVGFQDQLFANLSSGDRPAILWESGTPAVATVEQNGVVTALAEGTATIRATAPTGETATIQLRTRVAEASTTADYQGNAEFGEPADGDPSDDFLVRYPQFTVSFSPTRGTPNWASYNLEETHFGPEDRCDCFTFDPQLPSSFERYTTADYTGAGTYHGYGIDRGHLVRSFDRTSASLDNATTFYFTNIVPQAADNNQGPWAVLEDSLGKLARFADTEVYVVTGVAGSLGTVKDEGKIVIPETVWKVAVLLPADRGLEDVDDFGDLEVIAVNMPNVAGIRGNDWTDYVTTVDAIEALTGYDLLDRLPDLVERFVERGGSYRALRAEFAELSLAVDGALAGDEARALHASLEAAWRSIEKGNLTPAVGQLGAFKNKVADLARSGALGAEQARALTEGADRILAVVRD